MKIVVVASEPYAEITLKALSWGFDAVILPLNVKYRYKGGRTLFRSMIVCVGKACAEIYSSVQDSLEQEEQLAGFIESGSDEYFNLYEKIVLTCSASETRKFLESTGYFPHVVESVKDLMNLTAIVL